jgi:O-antigen ligase
MAPSSLSWAKQGGVLARYEFDSRGQHGDACENHDWQLITVNASYARMFWPRNAAQWLFYVALFFAVWAYGGTTSWSIQLTDTLLAGVLVLWVIELLLNRRKPRYPAFLLFILTGLFALGGWMTLNAGAILDTDFSVFVPIAKFIPHAPGSIDYALSAAWMIRVALLWGTILFVADLSQDNRALLQLCYAIGFVAGSIALLGLLQKATGAPMIFWQPSPNGPIKTFFATFYYHANAGAFLNLVLPLTAGLALRAFTAPSGPNVRAMWAACFVLCLASVAANTSRMAQFVAFLIVIALAWRLGPALLRRLSRTERKAALSGALAFLFVLYALAQASHLDQPLDRWRQLTENIPSDARLLADRVAISILPEAGAVGFGPGTFRVLFPVYNNMHKPPVPGFWRFLHEDYLQTVLEWGWLGAGLWGLLFFGGIAVAIRNLRKPSARSWSRRRLLILPLAVIALCGVAIHAVVDFPLQIASIQLYAATFLGVCWGSTSWKAEARGEVR